MRLVLDTNQTFIVLSQLRPGSYRLTLSPYVLAEIVLHGGTRQKLRRLECFDVVLGLEVPKVMESVRSLDEAGIRSFEPFFTEPKTRTIICQVADDDLKWAEKIKANGRQFCTGMYNSASNLRKGLVARGISKTAKVGSIQQAIDELPDFFKGLVLDCITNENRRTTAVQDREKLYCAVMENPYLARLFKTTLYFVLSWSRMWQDQTHNFDASPLRDDWPDMTVPLYAADGDVILSADTKLRNAVCMIEPSGSVQAKTVEELSSDRHYV